MEENLSEKQQLKILQNHSLTSGKDLVNCVLLVFITLIAWIIPEKFWKLFTVPLAVVQIFIFHKVVRSRINIIGKICGDHLKIPSPKKIEICRLADLFEARIQYMREYRPGGWNPCFHIYGKEHIEKSLGKGQGTILWVAPFHFTELVVKKGLAQSGLKLSYLSIYRHGFSPTRFGLKFLNPIWKKVENKYLHERIVIQPDGQLSYLRRIEKILRLNGVFAIGCIPSKGQKTIPQKILNGTFPFPTGPASLALATNASLLPVFLVQRSSGEFDLIIETPLDIPLNNNRHENINIIMADFCKVIEGYVIKNPTAFRFWDHGKELRPL